jgi:hypothetical protein
VLFQRNVLGKGLKKVLRKVFEKEDLWEPEKKRKRNRKKKKGRKVIIDYD